MKRIAAYFLAAAVSMAAAVSAFGQTAILNGGAVTPGHGPMYVSGGTRSQVIATDSGGAGGGGVGVGYSEVLIAARGTGTAPYAGQGTGPLGTNLCDYDGPITAAAGYHYLCFSANAQGGGLVTYGAGGAASQLPMQFVINGVTYPFPGSFANLTIGLTPVVGGSNGQCLYVSAGVVNQQNCQLTAITSLTGDGTATGPGSSVLTLAQVNLSPGTCGSGALVPVVTVNAKGLVTNCSTSPFTLTVGTTLIAGGVTNEILFNNGGVLGNLSTLGSAVLSTNGGGTPAFSTTLPSGLSVPSPTITGTATFPDASTYTSAGLTHLLALSVGAATALPSSGNINVSGQYQVNGSQIAAANLSNGTTGSGAVVLAAGPTLSGTVAGNFTLSGNLTLSGNNTLSGQAIHTGTSAPASAAGNTVIMGTIAAPTLTNTAQAFVYNTAVNGAVVEGDGSTYDVVLANKSGGVAIGIGTGTTVPILPGLASGTCSNGLAVDAGNNVVKVACPGAAASVQVGTTTVSSGTSHGVLTNTAGVLGNTAAGTTGQHLTSNGASADPTFQSGGWVLLNTLTGSGGATLSDTTSLTSTYNEYEIVFSNVVPATNTTSFELQVHSGGIFQSSSYFTTGIGNNNASAATFDNPSTFIPLSHAATVANSTPGVSGSVRITTPSTTAFHSVWGVLTYATSIGSGIISTSGYWNSSAAIDGFQVLFNSGNITSGTIKIYGRL